MEKLAICYKTWYNIKVNKLYMSIHFSLKRVIGLVFMFIGVTLSLTVFPETALAATNNAEYQPRNQQEFASYLQGIVDTLEAQKNAKYTNSNNTSALVQTKAAEVASEVELKSTFEMGKNKSIYAWFEYGENGQLNKSTSRTRIADNKKDEVTHTRTIKNLKSNTVYSYRAVFETSRGIKHYGQVKTFQLGASTASLTAPSTGSSVSTNKGSLSTNATSYAYGSDDTIDVSWTLTSSRNDSKNWIGMYKVGDSSKNYQSWRYVDGDSGIESFKIKEKGTFEFRLFLNNSYSSVVTSRRVTIQ